jgi:asparagine synthase (glutamine-hydrolysing)
VCGIAGGIGRHGPLDETKLHLAADRLAHRGPYDAGFHLADAVGLVHTRLPIIDLAGGHQPLVDPTGDLAVVVNGEIYNFVELRRELEDAGHRFATASDSEVVLHLYAEGGVAAFQRLHGMFAFALYDRRRRSLILARDRLGIKPLYYAALPDRLVFASEIKGLLPLLQAGPELNAAAVDRFLEDGFNSGEETLVRGVRKVPPGSAMRVDPDLEVTTTHYWSVQGITQRELDLDEALEEFDGLFAQVLHEHMRADVPYGLFLSGGLDSGTLLAHLTRTRGEPLQTFTVRFEGEAAHDESARAFALSRMYGSEHSDLVLNPDQVLGALPLMVWAADDPIHDLACLPTALLAHQASQGLRVVFTGEGGDEVFAGYGRYRRSALQRLVKGIAYPRTGGYRTASHWNAGLRRLAFGPALRAARHERRTPLRQAWGDAPPTWSYLDKAQYADLGTELANSLLVKVDRMLMAFGVEGRVPFLDHRIVEFGLSLPDRLKVQGRTGKVLLRHWVAKDLPPEHLTHRKQGFGVPLSAALTPDRLTRIAARLRENPLIREWFGASTVDTLVRPPVRGANLRPLLQLMQLAIWHRLFVAGPTERPPMREDVVDWLA